MFNYNSQETIVPSRENLPSYTRTLARTILSDKIRIKKISFSQTEYFTTTDEESCTDLFVRSREPLSWEDGASTRLFRGFASRVAVQKEGGKKRKEKKTSPHLLRRLPLDRARTERLNRDGG